MQMDFKCIINCLWGWEHAKRIGEMTGFLCSDDLGIQFSLLPHQKSLAHQWDSNYCIQNEWHRVNAARPSESKSRRTDEEKKKNLPLKFFLTFFFEAAIDLKKSSTIYNCP